MKRAVLGMLAIGLLVGGLIACRQVLRSPVDEAGALLWEMTEIHTAGRDAFLTRRGSAAERDAAIGAAARDLAAHRDRLAALIPSLDSASDLAVRLQKFVVTWPTAEAFRDDLMDGSARGGRAGVEITGLAWLAPDTRLSWKTPFRQQRP